MHIRMATALLLAIQVMILTRHNTRRMMMMMMMMVLLLLLLLLPSTEHPQCARTQIHGVVSIRIEMRPGREEQLRCFMRSHGLGDPIRDRDDGFLFRDEPTADVHAREAPEERLFFFAREAVDFGCLDEICAAVQVAAPFFGVACRCHSVYYPCPGIYMVGHTA